MEFNFNKLFSISNNRMKQNGIEKCILIILAERNGSYTFLLIHFISNNFLVCNYQIIN